MRPDGIPTRDRLAKYDARTIIKTELNGNFEALDDCATNKAVNISTIALPFAFSTIPKRQPILATAKFALLLSSSALNCDSTVEQLDDIENEADIDSDKFAISFNGHFFVSTKYAMGTTINP